MSKPELRPCPHCGGEAENHHYNPQSMPEFTPFWRTECLKCRDALKLGYDTAAESSAAWNRRAADPKIVERIAQTVLTIERLARAEERSSKTYSYMDVSREAIEAVTELLEGRADD